MLTLARISPRATEVASDRSQFGLRLKPTPTGVGVLEVIKRQQVGVVGSPAGPGFITAEVELNAADDSPSVLLPLNTRMVSHACIKGTQT